MHNNYYFLRQLSKALDTRLRGSVVSECFSQDKDELMVRFETTAGSFYIRASTLPNFACLSFPAGFNRARKNSVDLFDMLVGRRVTEVIQFKNERSFAIGFAEGFNLLFKMHGNRANVLVFRDLELIALFRNNIAADRNIRLDQLHREIDWSFEGYKEHASAPERLYFTFGKPVWQYLSARGFDTTSTDQRWVMIQEVIRILEHPTYYLTAINEHLVLALLPIGNIEREETDPLVAVNAFYSMHHRLDELQKEKAVTLSRLKANHDNLSNYQKRTAEKLADLQHHSNYREWADLIMANLHAIAPGSDQVVVANFFNNNEPVEIRMKKEDSAQKNAERFYRKAKNQQTEIARLENVLGSVALEIEQLKEMIVRVQATDDVKEIRKVYSAREKNTGGDQRARALPYHEHLVSGFRILVGKNAESNDILTQKFAHKDDLWLHAKDVAGSHVVVKQQSGKTFPKDVIERAAQLAAYHSKRKNESLCPVVVTQKKFVRKRKGDPAGMVVVERERVLMVEPKA